MSGAFEGDQLVEFVQMLGQSQKTGVLRIMSESSDAVFGALVFRDGKVVSAWTQRDSGQVRGIEAAYSLLITRRGSFEFRPGIPAGQVEDLRIAVEPLLLEALKRIDELPPGSPATPLPPEKPGERGAG
jgi:hypothetical protein